MALALSWVKKANAMLLFPAMNFYSKLNLSSSESLHVKDVSRLCKQGRLKDALCILNLMEHPDASVYASLLQACLKANALPQAKLLHSHIVLTGFNPFISLETQLVILYAKCGCLEDARHVFEEMPQRNAVSWTAMIGAYSRHGLHEDALLFYCQMQRTGMHPDRFTLATVLPVCANLAALKHGKQLHEDMIRNGVKPDVFVSSALIDMYAKCGNMHYARQVFEKMPERNVVSWNTMIGGYAQNGQVVEASNFFERTPKRNVVSWNTMITGYAKNGFVDDARKLFQKMPEQNVVSWNAIISGYSQNGHFDEALTLFQQMRISGMRPNSTTFAGVLPAIAGNEALQHGKAVHGCMIKSGLLDDIIMGNALVDMYAKCKSIRDAHAVFGMIYKRDITSWNVMMAGYAHNGDVDSASKLFNEMPERNAVTWNVMTAGYAQNGYFDEAMKLFEIMPAKNLVSWNMMIAAYCQNGFFNEALKLFQQMKLVGIKPNWITFATVLPACGKLAALQQGKEIHEEIIGSGFQSDIKVENAIVHMYAKCGSIDDAHKVFDKMCQRDIVSWNSMIAGYAMHGCCQDALQLFEQMQQSGIKPNDITFVGILSACCHAGLVDDGWKYFHSMSSVYNIAPSVEHYCSMVNLLGRAGHLDEAQEFINRMPVRPNAALWASFLGACRNHNNIELGERVAECLFGSDPQNCEYYVLLSNMYAAAGRWDDVKIVRKLMKDRSIQKEPGCSWVEVNNKVYAFVIGNRSYPQTQEMLRL